MSDLEKSSIRQFLKKLNDCVKEYKQKYNETRDDIDAAFYYNKDLKRFLEQNKDELDLLGGMNFDRGFISWVRNYLFKKKDE